MGVSKKKVCIVSNRPWFNRDYSHFIDSCDEVIRCNRMCNLDTGRTGSKTTLALVAACVAHSRYSPKEQRVDVLRKLDRVYFVPNPTPGQELSESFCKKNDIPSRLLVPAEVWDSHYAYSTFALAIALAEHLFPDAQLYCLGELEAASRVPAWADYHQKNGEDAYIQRMLDEGKLICIGEERATEYKYSKSPVNPDPRAWIEIMDGVRKTYVMHKLPDGKLLLQIGDIFGEVLCYEPGMLVVRWQTGRMSTYTNDGSNTSEYFVI